MTYSKLAFALLNIYKEAWKFYSIIMTIMIIIIIIKIF